MHLQSDTRYYGFSESYKAVEKKLHNPLALHVSHIYMLPKYSVIPPPPSPLPLFNIIWASANTTWHLYISNVLTESQWKASLFLFLHNALLTALVVPGYTQSCSHIFQLEK